MTKSERRMKENPDKSPLSSKKSDRIRKSAKNKEMWTGSSTKKGEKKVPKKDEWSEEDKKLQEELNLLVEKLSSSNQSLFPDALETLCRLIRASTTSMTSVPKPLKFLRPHYSKIKEIYKRIVDPKVQQSCADVISVLALTSANENSRECLLYRLMGSKEQISAWGHEYVRHLAAEIAEEWNIFDKYDLNYQQKTESLLNLARAIVPYHMKHNAEAEACDLLMEMERLDLLAQYVDAESQPRVCLYLTSCVPFVPDEENAKFLETAMEIYKKFDKQIEMLRCAIMLNDMESVETIFVGCKDLVLQKQMALILGRHQIFFELKDDMPNELKELMSNSNLSQYFLALARELDILEPKTPDDIYKTHLEPSRPFTTATTTDSARQNLAASFTNGFVNVGFCMDKLIKEDANKWFYKNKDFGMMTAAASQGLIYRWEVDVGLKEIDKYLYSNDEYIKAGSLLAVGIISNGIYHDCDPAQALLSDYVRSDKNLFRIGSIFGLGLAYANSKRESVKKTVIPLLLTALTDPHSNSEVLGITALSLGLICVATGTEHSNVVTTIWKVLLEKSESESDLKDTNLRYLALGIALIFLGKQQTADSMIETMKVFPEPFGSMAITLLEIAAYAGTGNVLKIQHLLYICSEHYETPKAPVSKDDKKKDTKDDKKGTENTQKETKGSKEGTKENKKETKDDKKKSVAGDKTPKADLSWQQSVAVLGIALIAMGEDVGTSMSFRLFGHLLRYGEPCIKRAVPLALGLISVSNPQLNIIETLSKFSHDSDPETTYSAIFALGLIGAGTNNARLALMLRQLAAYHQRDSTNLMLVRIAQGLVHMGKGTMTLSPFHSDRQLMSPSAVAGLLATCFAFLDPKNTIFAKKHYLLYSLVPAIQARLLITFEHSDAEGLKQQNVSVRVGQAVDVVGQAGKPKTITGFQTSTTPVLLALGERAELAVEEYAAVSPVLEGFVILKKVQIDSEKKKEKRVK